VTAFRNQQMAPAIPNSKFANRNPAVAAGSRRKAPLVEGILCSTLLHKYNTLLEAW